MKITIMRRLIFLAFMSLFGLLLQAQGAINGWVVAKTAFYYQAADNTQPTTADRFDFYINIETDSGADAGAIALTGPGIITPLQMTQVEPGSWELTVDYASKAALDAAFPAGQTFTLTASGGTAGTVLQNFSVPNDNYPSVPYLATSGFSDLQSLDAYEPFFMSWNDHLTGSELLTIFPSTGGYWVVEVDVDAAYVLPADSLAGNAAYEGHLEFFNTSSQVPGAFGSGAFRFISLTSYPIATVPGFDDFNDNTTNLVKWADNGSEGFSIFSTTNQRLEYVAETNISGFVEWDWGPHGLSYTNDWAITVDAVNLLNPASLSSNESGNISLVVRGGDYVVGLEFIASQTDKRLETLIAYNPTDSDVLKEWKVVSVNQAMLRFSFDAETKLIHTSYSSGGVEYPLSTFSVEAWGMNASSSFTASVFGENNNGLQINPGLLYLDNFEIHEVVTESGYDNFDDNVVDTQRWAPFYQDSGHDLYEANGQMEYTSPAVVDGSYGWSWAPNPLSAASDWSVMVDAAYNSDFTGSENTDLVLSIEGSTNVVALKFSNQGFGSFVFHSLAFDLVTDDAFFETTNYFSNLPSTVLRIDYEAATKTFKTYCLLRDQFNPIRGAFIPLATISAVAWGLTEDSEFYAAIYVDNTGTSVPAGAMSFDDFRLWLEETPVSFAGDVDRDGLPDDWEVTYFGYVYNPQSSPFVDGDGDGFNNVQEQIAGTNPTNGSSVFAISDSGTSPSGFVLNWTAVEGRTYGVNWTDSLTNSFSVLTNDILYPQNSYTDTVHSANGEGFYNLQVELEN